MKTNLLTKRLLAIVSVIGAIGVSPLVAGSALAATIAGWDFSQWSQPGLLSIDGASPANTLAANYSNLDPTNNAGAESAAFGTLYFNGQFGSTQVVPDGTGNEPFVPVTQSLTSNINGIGPNPFDSLTVLTFEGQQFANLMSMGAQDPLSVVFEADLTGVPESGSDWLITFGAKTGSGASTVGISFSTDGINYNSVGTVNLTTSDTAYSVNLFAGALDRGFVRFSFDPTEGQQLLIDNVAVNATLASVPEPAAAGLLLAGLLGVAALRGRHA